MDCPALRRVTSHETAAAHLVVSKHAIRTPLVPLEYSRPDAPDLTIYLKLETLQPRVRSFKVRGAANAVVSRLAAGPDEDDEKGEGEGGDDGLERLVVTASAGNMGRAVASVCRSLEEGRRGRRRCRCVVVVPDSAPATKTAAVEALGAEVVRVPYDRWWEIIETSDCSGVEAVGNRPHIFVHPVCDPHVVAGNSTCGAEILEDLPDVDAILVPYGGGGLSCGIGSAVLNEHERKRDDGGERRRKCSVVSCEPETAAPMALSKECGEMMPFQDLYEPSFCDGCGGKAVLSPMWPLANEVIDSSVAVPLEGIEAGVWALHELNGLVAEGAAGTSVGAAMLCPLERLGEDASSWKKIVCVVSGGGVDRSKLLEIIARYDSVNGILPLVGRLNWTPRGSPSSPLSCMNSPKNTQSVATTALPPPGAGHRSQMRVLSETEVLQKLPMHACIDAAAEALVSLSTKKGIMPLRSVSKLPAEEIHKTGFLVSMPSYYGGYAACKLITVYPDNGGGSGFSSHQGVVALFNAKNHGELLLLADAHTVTAQRTAAASAAATRVLARSESRALSLLGTGEQARSHFVAMLETGLPIDIVRIWGRNRGKAEQLERDLRDIARRYPWQKWPGRLRAESITLEVCDSAQDCVKFADIICSLVPSYDPVLEGTWVKTGAHINAVGACIPAQRELDGECVRKSTLYCDSSEACSVEAGDVVIAVQEGAISKDHVRGEIGQVLNGQLAGREDEEQITLFKSLGVALEDLMAAKLIYEQL